MERLELSKLALSNWKSHSSTEIEFSPGNNIILGTMGAGKSSIVSGIVFAFFGEIPETRNKRARLDDLISEGADYSEVSLGFSLGGTPYLIRRRIEREKGSVLSEIRDSSGKLIEGPMSEKVTFHIRHLTGLDYSLFVRAIYLEQNEIDAFLSEGRGKRREGIDRLLGISAVEEARKGLLPVLALLRAEWEIHSREDYSKKLPELEEARKNLLEGLSKKASEKEALEKEISGLWKSVSERSRRISSLESLESSLKKAQDKREFLSKRISELEARLSKYSGKLGSESSAGELLALESSRRELERILREESSKQALLLRVNSREEILLGRLSGAKRAPGKGEAELTAEVRAVRLRHLKAASDGALAKKQVESSLKAQDAVISLKNSLGKFARVDSLLSERRDSLARVSEKRGALERDLSELSSARDALKAHKEGRHGDSFPCPVCLNPLSEESREKLLSDKERKIDSVSAELIALGEEKRGLEREIIALELASKEQSKEAGELEERSREADLLGERKERAELLDSLEKSLALEKEALEKSLALEKEAALAESELSSLRKEKESLEKELSALKGLSGGRTLESIDSEISEKRLMAESFSILSEIRKANSEAEGALLEESELGKKFSPTALKEERAMLEKESFRAGALSERLSRIPREISESQKSLGEAESEIAGAKGKEERKRKVSSAIEFSKALDSALKGAMAKLRDGTISEINRTLSSYWSLLYPYSNYSALRLESKDNDYSLELKGNRGAWVEAERVASGGEKSLACLALRTSFSRALAPGLGLMILDEPTHNLDSNAISLLTETFRERISPIASQTIIITHEEALEGAATGSCYRITRENGGKSAVIALA